MARKRVKVFFEEGSSLAHQSFKDECDINVLMRRYEKTGMINHVNKHQGEYGDFINAPDYHSAMNQIIEARESFMTIPARIRARFGNDPAEFLAFVQDPANEAEMREMGLLPAQRPQDPDTLDPPPEAPKGKKPPKASPAASSADTGQTEADV